MFSKNQLSFPFLVSIGIHLTAISVIGTSFLPTLVIPSPLKKPIKFEIKKRKLPSSKIKPLSSKVKKVKFEHRMQKTPLPPVRKFLQTPKVATASRRVVFVSKPMKKTAVTRIARVEKSQIRYPTRNFKKMAIARTPRSSLEVLPVSQLQTKRMNKAGEHKLPSSLSNAAKPIRPSTLTNFKGSFRRASLLSGREESKTIKEVSSGNSTDAFLYAKFNPRPAPYIENRGDSVDAYLGAIRSRLERVKKYPSFAKRAGMVGKVFVKFTLNQFGDPKDIILVKACPFKRLNDEALNAVKRAAPFPEFPAALRKKEMKVTIPFLFQLN